MKVSVSRKEFFNAAHRLHNPLWSAEKNREVFGLCNNENYHGHNYTIIVTVKGEIDANTGYVIDMKKLSSIIREEIVVPFDHQNLNLDTLEFKEVNPTAENMVVIFWNKIRTRLPANLTLSITLYETERNFVEYNGNEN